jgi:hypothetical protein
MDSHVMHHRDGANSGNVTVSSNSRRIASQASLLRSCLMPVQLVAAALWHGIKAVW